MDSNSTGDLVARVSGLTAGQACLVAMTLAVLPVEAARRTAGSSISKAQLTKIAEASVASGGKAIGTQILIGRGDEIHYFKSFGRRSPQGNERVDADTMFCIGSCSKPVSSVTILRMADAGELKLDQTVDAWVPGLSHKRLTGGGTVNRVPTMIDLLCHRGGIFSQKKSINQKQVKLLYRSFDQSLEKVANAMADFAYISEPGSDMAYSGAGYCIAGRVAEVAANKEFDAILQEQLCQPLGMGRTTYFPGRIDSNIATGEMKKQGKVSVDKQAPHRSQPHRMQLIGGSLYSTAPDLAKFLAMIARKGATNEGRFLSATRWSEMLRQRGSSGRYGLGWIITRQGKRVILLGHSGALFQYRANLAVHVPSQSYLVFLTTLSAEGGVRGKKAGNQKSKQAKSGLSAGPAAVRYFQQFAKKR